VQAPVVRRGYRRSAVALGSLLLGFAPASPARALHAVQPNGPGGCIDRGGSEGCARGISFSEQSSLGPLAVSPNGAFLYVVDSPLTGSPDRNNGRLLIFARNRRTGALRQLPGRRGCLENTFTPVRSQHGPCELLGGIENPNELAISPDGRRLYAATAGVLGSYLVTFALDPRRGDVRRLQCLTNVTPSRCASAPLSVPNALVVSPDSRFVYVGSLSESATGAAPLLHVYSVGKHGLLAQQCLAEAVIHDLGCTAAPALSDGSVEGLAQTPDGSVLYASAAAADFRQRIVALARDPRSGRLAPLSAAGDCVSDEPTPPAPCAAVALTGTDLAMSPSGDTLYAATNTASGKSGAFGIAALARDSASGALSEPAGPAGCIVFGGTPAPGCGANSTWRDGLQLPPLSPRPDVLLAGFDEAGGTAGALVQIARSPSTGALLASDVRGCEPAACPPLRGTQEESAAIAASPDNRTLYLADGGGIAVLQVTP
jgi:hypothetical protein